MPWQKAFSQRRVVLTSMVALIVATTTLVISSEGNAASRTDCVVYYRQAEFHSRYGTAWYSYPWIGQSIRVSASAELHIDTCGNIWITKPWYNPGVAFYYDNGLVCVCTDGGQKVAWARLWLYIHTVKGLQFRSQTFQYWQNTTSSVEAGYVDPHFDMLATDYPDQLKFYYVLRTFVGGAAFTGNFNVTCRTASPGLTSSCTQSSGWGHW